MPQRYPVEVASTGGSGCRNKRKQVHNKQCGNTVTWIHIFTASEILGLNRSRCLLQMARDSFCQLRQARQLLHAARPSGGLVFGDWDRPVNFCSPSMPTGRGSPAANGHGGHRVRAPGSPLADKEVENCPPSTSAPILRE